LHGEVGVPDVNGDTHLVEVRLVRSDSKQSDSEDCIARFIATVADRLRPLVHVEQKPEPLDLQRELGAWDERQGVQLTEEESHAELTRWLGEVKAQPNRDPHGLGLARFAEKRFARCFPARAARPCLSLPYQG
jgi:hypothetical protein